VWECRTSRVPVCYANFSFFVAGRLPFELFRKVTGMQYE